MFSGRRAVVTGGGTGMGRELVRQLAREGCHVAMCDISEGAMQETVQLCSDAPPGTRVLAYVADVSDEAQVLRFRDHVASNLQSDQLDYLFNNAGISGGGASLIEDPRVDWERTFGVCWFGVYYCTRAFLPMLLKAPAGHLVNTSSAQGLSAHLAPNVATNAYTTAKFAVRGFTESLITDFRINAPQMRVSLVIPGHVGTSIRSNSAREFGRDPSALDETQLEDLRAKMLRRGKDLSDMSDDEVRQLLLHWNDSFRNHAPLDAEGAAAIILDGVRQQRWRILVGEDAVKLDQLIRENPEDIYAPGFWERIKGEILLESTRKGADVARD